jgi:hypothetical protein
VREGLVGDSLEPLDVVQAREDHLETAVGFVHHLPEVSNNREAALGIRVQQAIHLVQENQNAEILAPPLRLAELAPEESKEVLGIIARIGWEDINPVECIPQPRPKSVRRLARVTVAECLDVLVAGVVMLQENG